MSFRGINTTVIQIRRQVFTEVARMAYANVKGEQANHLMRKIPYTIIPGEEGKLRKDIFLERAIVEERVRLAMGLPTRRMDEHNSVVSGLEDASIAERPDAPMIVLSRRARKRYCSSTKCTDSPNRSRMHCCQAWKTVTSLSLRPPRKIQAFPSSNRC